MQKSLDDMTRGERGRGTCAWCRPTSDKGLVVQGMVILGHCRLFGRDAYDQDCDMCPEWRPRR